MYTNNYADDVVFYKMTVTIDRKKCTYCYKFPQPVSVWYMATDYKSVTDRVDWYYSKGADAVELEMITREQFDSHPNPTYRIKNVLPEDLAGDPDYPRHD